MLVAIFGDFSATNKFHDKIRPARLRCSGIEYFGNVGMVHQRERLSFSVESRNDAFRVHAWFDDLQGHPPTNRFLLLSHEDYTAAAFADLLQQVVTSYSIAGLFTDGHSRQPFDRQAVWRLLQECAGAPLNLEKDLHLGPQNLIASTCSIQKSGAFVFGKIHSFSEKSERAIGVVIHDLSISLRSQAREKFQ